jgi:dolichol-phosphate mannosyltransferase
MQPPLAACVVIPTYNERENVGPLVEAIESLRLPGLLVMFVDDSSPDGTADEIRRVAANRPYVHLIVRAGKKGLGSAHIEGFKHAMDELGAQVLMEMDADLQHPPSKIPELISALARGNDVVVASRKIEGGGTTGWSLWRRAVSGEANIFARLVLGLKVKDCTSGFRALDRRAAEILVDAHLPDSGYSFQVASLFYLKKRGMKMAEVPFTFGTRKLGSSKMGSGEIGRFFLSILRLRILGD